jgi:outer membrane lipoprotein-sorting protein
MKKGLLILLLITSGSTVFSQTADEVINKFIIASGGREKLNAVNTLQYSQTLTMTTPFGEFKIPMEFYKEKDKLFRVQSSMQFGGQSFNFFTLVTDTAGYVMLPAVPMMGSEGGLQKMTESERSSQLYQTDAAGLFSSLVDYAAKGNKIELLTGEKVNDEDCYKVKVILRNGPEMTYFISKATNLIVRTDAKGGAAANMGGLGALTNGIEAQAAKAEVSSLYSGYTDVKGIKFPTKMTIKNQMGDATSEIANIKINEPIDPKFYMPQ